MGNRLAIDFQRRAEEKAKAANVLLDATDFSVDAKKQAQFVVGKLTGNIMFLLAEMLDYESGTAAIDENQARRNESMAAMDNMRTAAAKGDWDEWNRLVEGHAIGGDAGGD